MEYLTIGIISYLMGSIPFGFILTKIFLKKDIREIGSGNIGATNALRTGNNFIGYSTLLLDVLKAVLPVIYVKLNYPELIYIASLCAFLGHVFPIWLKFKGGKGVATYIGYLFAVNYLLGFIFIFSWLIIAGIKKYSSLASILSLIILPFAAMLLSYENIILLLFFLISVIIISKHYYNILRLLNKTESKIKF